MASLSIDKHAKIDYDVNIKIDVEVKVSVTIRRQAHGIKAVTQAITLPGGEMARLKREARDQEITVSRHVVNLIRAAWAAGAATDPDGDCADEQAVA